MYSIELSNLAAKELERIYTADHKIYSRLITVVESLRENPYQGKKLKGRLEGSYSVRVGSYRVVYSIYKAKLIIYVIDIGHRREVYR